MLSFVAWGRLHSVLISFCLSFPFCFLIAFQFSSLLASLVALPFAMFATPGLDNLFPPCMLFGSGRLFLVSSLGSGLSVIDFHSLSLMLFLFFPCFTWYRCAELVSWSFGILYPELCGFSLAWAPCLWFFSLWGVSHFLTYSCASGALSMCLLA